MMPPAAHGRAVEVGKGTVTEILSLTGLAGPRITHSKIWTLSLRFLERKKTWLFSSTSTYHSTDLLTARGVAHLVVHGISGPTSYETIPRVRLETSGGVLSTADMVVQRRDGPRRLREIDDDGLILWG